MCGLQYYSMVTTNPKARLNLPRHILKIQMQIKAAVDPTAANGRIVTSVMLVWSLAPGVAVAL